MARSNTLTVQRRAASFFELATVLLATEDRIGMERFNAKTEKEMQDAFSDLAEAMGFDLLAMAPPKASRPISVEDVARLISTDIRAAAALYVAAE